jgi:hypothetical protein
MYAIIEHENDKKYFIDKTKDEKSFCEYIKNILDTNFCNKSLEQITNDDEITDGNYLVKINDSIKYIKKYTEKCTGFLYNYQIKKISILRHFEIIETKELDIAHFDDKDIKFGSCIIIIGKKEGNSKNMLENILNNYDDKIFSNSILFTQNSSQKYENLVMSPYNGDLFKKYLYDPEPGIIIIDYATNDLLVDINNLCNKKMDHNKILIIICPFYFSVLSKFVVDYFVFFYENNFRDLRNLWTFVFYFMGSFDAFRNLVEKSEGLVKNKSNRVFQYKI